MRLRPLFALSFLAANLMLVLRPADAGQTARGTVFHDANSNGRFDPGEAGMAGVRVSNGREVIRTDAAGRYELSVDDDTIVFVIKPRNWMTRIDEHRLPRFYYVHKPGGSPANFKFSGVAPTGPLPEAIDFALTPHSEADRCQVLLFGDPQPRDQREVDYVTHDVVDTLIGSQVAFGVSLGDVMFDDLSLFESQNAAIAQIGCPWYNVHGNHDMNYDATEDRFADETWERVFGPATYSFDWGPAHFVILDNVHYDGGERKEYHGEFGRARLDWLRADLEHVPKDQLVILMTHIPVPKIADSPQVYTKDCAELFALLADRPYTLSLSAHMHTQTHYFVGAEHGWTGASPHHHFNAGTVSGSWWAGAPDEVGIPHTMMRDGTPNGYHILTIDGTRYELEYRVARAPADYQMNIFAPETVAADAAPQAEVVVNVFAGSLRSIVEMRVDEGAWTTMERVEMIDPFYAQMKSLEQFERMPPGRKLPAPVPSSHIWRGFLPTGMSPGTHVIEVRTKDMFGRLYTAHRCVRVK